ncbi:MAG: acyl-CoA dehydrogenase family protein [Proteobacteria bacterium]|nr:acyl-CoA dehydrogenase family protein [Pseudomonadota bacterium]
MEDLFYLEEQFTTEEKLIKESVRRFVDEALLPHIASNFEKAEFPLTLIEKVAALGLFGMTLPTDYGGANTNYVAYGLACQELERGDSGLRSFVSVQSSLCMYPIFAYGSEEQKQRFLPKMATGEIIGCFGLTEPDAGSDPSSMTTRATKVQGGWRLNGAKMWITNATIASLAIIWAKDENEIIQGFIVEKKFPGFKALEIKHKLSLRASITGEIALENCFVPEENRLVQTKNGLGAALGCLTKARYGIAWGAMGAAMACYDIALQYAKERLQFGRPIASFQLIQKDLANMFNEIVKMQMLNLQLGRLMDADRASYVMVSLAKMNACKEALKIARMARNILGANGISLEYHVIRHMNNLESVFTYEGTDNMHHLIIGKHITGISSFK